MAVVAAPDPLVSLKLSHGPSPTVRVRGGAHYVRGLLDSENLLKKFAEKLWREFDRDRNGLIDRAELHNLCESMHDQLGLPVVNDIQLGRKIAEFDLDCEGGVAQEQFHLLVRSLLHTVLDQEPSRNPPARGSALPHGAEARSRSNVRVAAATATWLAGSDANRTYVNRGSPIAGNGALESLQLNPGIASNGPTDLRFVRAILDSEVVLEQYARKVFRRFDLDGNQRISAEELRLLCETMHASLGLEELENEQVVGELARFADDFSGSLSMKDFVPCFRHLLQRALDSGMVPPVKSTSSASSPPARFPGPFLPQSTPSPPLKLPRMDSDLPEDPADPQPRPADPADAARAPVPEVAVGDEVWAPFFGEPSGTLYRALLKEVLDDSNGSGKTAALTWLRPPEGQNPEQYVVTCGRGLDDTECRAVPLSLVTRFVAPEDNMFCE